MLNRAGCRSAEVCLTIAMAGSVGAATLATSPKDDSHGILGTL